MLPTIIIFSLLSVVFVLLMRPGITIQVASSGAAQRGSPLPSLFLFIFLPIFIIFVFFPARQGELENLGRALFQFLLPDLSASDVEANDTNELALRSVGDLNPPVVEDEMTPHEREVLLQILLTPTATIEENEENAKPVIEGENQESDRSQPDVDETTVSIERYVVVDGDTLFSISSRYGLTVDEIAQFNGILNVNLIDIGQVIFIPTSGAGQGQGGGSPPPRTAAPIQPEINQLEPSGGFQLELHAKSSSMMELQWVNVANEDGYKVLGRRNDVEEWKLMGTAVRDQTDLTFIDLLPGTNYQFQVQAFNIDGVLNSNVAERVTLAVVDDDLKQKLIQPENNRLLIKHQSNSGIDSFDAHLYELVTITSTTEFSLIGCREHDTASGTRETMRWEDSGTWELKVISGENFQIEFRPASAPPFFIHYVDGAYFSPVVEKDVLTTSSYQC